MTTSFYPDFLDFRPDPAAEVRIMRKLIAKHPIEAREMLDDIPQSETAQTDE